MQLLPIIFIAFVILIIYILAMPESKAKEIVTGVKDERSDPDPANGEDHGGGIKYSHRLLATLALAVFIISPIISLLIASKTRSNGSTWFVSEGMIYGCIFWGVASTIGMILGFLAIHIKRTKFSVLILVLNSIVAVPFLLLSLYGLINS